MDIQEVIEKLEQEWDENDRFFGRLRYGKFDSSGLENVITILRSIDTTSETYLDKRLVSLLWFTPTFMRWQIERFKEQDIAKDIESGNKQLWSIFSEF